jgi:hypothetical protein
MTKKSDISKWGGAAAMAGAAIGSAALAAVLMYSSRLEERTDAEPTRVPDPPETD